MANCIKHSFELSVATCQRCNNGFCARCLVFPFGDKKPGLCVPCALAASGVRTNAGSQPAVVRVEPKESWAQARARKKAEKAARKGPDEGDDGSGSPSGTVPSPFAHDPSIRLPTPH